MFRIREQRTENREQRTANGLLFCSTFQRAILCSLFSVLLVACGSDKGTEVSLNCDKHSVAGRITEETAEVRIDGGIVRTMPLFAKFTDEIVAKHMPHYLAAAQFATTNYNFINMTPDGEKIVLTAYARSGRFMTYELEMGKKKWPCR
ncbi:MAG: hypothetical protein LBL46_02015 [Rickettsiales bacterium]|jgi:hypothetical protein|nr:hypothetical protein [Rickettsiales bacterium]